MGVVASKLTLLGWTRALMARKRKEKQREADGNAIFHAALPTFDTHFVAEKHEGNCFFCPHHSSSIIF